MATLYKTDGTTEAVKPIGGFFSLPQLYQLTECDFVQAVPLPDGTQLWMDEEGKLKPNPVINERATFMFGQHLLPGDYFVGPILHTLPGEIDTGDEDDGQ